MANKHEKMFHITHYQRNIYQNYSEASHQSEWPSKNLQTINTGDDVEKREQFYTVTGNVN